MPDAAEEQLGEYFDYLWHDTTGVAYLPTQTDPLDPTSWVKNAFNWPADRAKVIRFTLRRTAAGQNVFAAPSLFKSLPGAGQRNDVLGSWTLYMDFDGNAPDDWSDKPVPEPDWINQSSLPGHQHVYWQLDEFLTDAEVIEDRNRAMSYALGADTSGWDANQILRPPLTTNYPDPKKKRGPVEVQVLARYTGTHNIEDFGGIVSAKQLVATTILEADIPDIMSVIATQRWTQEMLDLFNMSHQDLLDARLDRSASMARLGYMGAELGFDDEQIMSVLQNVDLRWEKYLHRRDRDRHLIDIINRARQKHGYLKPGEMTFAGLLGNAPVETDGDQQLVYGFGEFVESDFHVEWQFDELLAEEGIGMCVGYPGTGKTQWVIQAGASLALGMDFLGYKNTRGHRKVLFLSLEMSPGPLNQFLSLIAPEYDDQETLNKNFKLAPLGNPLPLDLDAGRNLLNVILAEQQPDLVIIDSLQMIMSKESTDEMAVKEAMNYLKSVREKFHCSMLIVHHNRKRNAQDAKKHAELSDMYGSTYIAAAVDFVINLAKLEDAEGKLRQSMLKNRLGPTINPFEIIRNERLTYHRDSSTFEGFHNEPENTLSI